MTQAENTSTEAENIFEAFCVRNKIRYIPIPCASGKTPDYDVTFNDHTVVIELKQLDQSDDDRDLFKLVRKNGFVATRGKADKRVRLKIQAARKQLKARSKGVLPSILIIFDNGTPEGVNSTDIKTAMYGAETVDIFIPEHQATIISPIRPGGGRKFTEDWNTSISAIGLLNILGDTRLLIFHNHFAAVPINPDWLRINTVHHFKIDPTDRSIPYEWVEV